MNSGNGYLFMVPRSGPDHTTIAEIEKYFVYSLTAPDAPKLGEGESPPISCTPKNDKIIVYQNGNYRKFVVRSVTICNGATDIVYAVKRPACNAPSLEVVSIQHGNTLPILEITSAHLHDINQLACAERDNETLRHQALILEAQVRAYRHFQQDSNERRQELAKEIERIQHNPPQVGERSGCR